MELILASASPRRKSLLEMVGLEFLVIPSDADEGIQPCPPGEMVEKLALIKAASVKEGRQDCCVIGCDTVVVVDTRVLGKPSDGEDAVKTLGLLQGRTHEVYTGLCLITDDRQLVCHDVASVTFSPMSEPEIRSYVKTGEPMDKAGAYGIQGVGGMFVERIEGSYFTVVGLPLHMLYRMLRDIGVSAPDLIQD